jgi:hypothetical protein
MPTFTDYALFRMAARGIERGDVELVLADSDDDFASREEPFRHIYARRIHGRLLYVVVEPHDHDRVVNAFWPLPKDRRR